MKVLVFDIWGEYAHFKKIYATTSALTYAIPPKPSVYGYLGAILGLEKTDNAYLTSFSDKMCRVGISITKPLSFLRLGINLKAELGRKKEGDPPKPTMMEFVNKPRYRLYVSHDDTNIFETLSEAVKNHSCFYTPTLGLACLLSNFEFVGVFDTDKQFGDKPIWIESVIPRCDFIRFDDEMFMLDKGLAITEQSLYAVEMNVTRDVTERDDVLIERSGKPILAHVKTYYSVNGANICLF